MSKIRGLTEVVIMVQDMEKSLQFYRDLLGMRVLAQPDARGAVFLHAGDPEATVPQQVVLVPRPASAPPLPADRAQRVLHHIGVELAPEDFDSERERLQSQGMEVRYGEHPFLPLKGLYIDDPDGNEVELITTR